MPERPRLVAGVDISRRFTSEEVLDLHRSGRLRQLAEAGYVGQGDVSTATVQFVPFEDSTFFRANPAPLAEGVVSDLDGLSVQAIHPDSLEERRRSLEAEHPMLRTTPQQKVARMMLRLMAEVKRTGRITGLSDADVKRIVGEGWKIGEPLSAEAVRRVAAHYLGQGEKTNREADSHRVTRKHPLA